MNKKIILAGLLSVGLIACDKSETAKNTDPAARVPEKLAFQAPTPQGAPVDQQAIVAELQGIFAGAQATLPPSALIFEKDKTTQAEKEKLEKELAAKDAVGLKLLNDIRSANCQVQDVAISKSAGFPEEGQEYKPRQGDSFEASATAGIVGSNCPVELSGSAKGGLFVEELDEQNKKAALSGSAGYSLKTVVKTPEYQTWLKSRGLLADFSINGLIVLREKTKTLINGSFSANYYTLTGEIKTTTTGQMLSKSDNSSNYATTQTESVLTVDATLPSGKKVTVVQYQIQVTTPNSSKVLVNDVYVNGHKQTEQQQKQIFGRNTPGLGHLSQTDLNKALAL